MRKILLLFLLFTPCFYAYSVTITGNAFLDNSSDYTGIEVRFNPESPSAEYVVGYTLADGSFSVFVEPGIYTIEYYKSSYQIHEVSEGLFLSEDMMLNNVTLSSQPLENISGTVSGDWYSDIVYNIVGDVIVSSGQTLTIEPGTLIQFESGSKLIVYGKLLSEGTIEENITYTSAEVNKTAGDWGGIFIYGSNTSIINNAILEYAGSEADAKAIVNVENSGRLQISNCIIRNSERGGVYVQFGGRAIIKDNYTYNMSRGLMCNGGSTATISGNRVTDCTFYGISGSSTNATVENNYVSNCDMGIMCESNITISKNILHNNTKGVFPRNCQTPVFTNNTFLNNTYGVRLEDSEYLEVSIGNNIFINNSYAISNEIVGEGTPKSIEYNLFYNNGSIYNGSFLALGSIISTNSNGTPCDTYLNLFEDPSFASSNPDDENFVELLPTSVCIDAGDPNILDENGTTIEIGAKMFESVSTEIIMEDRIENRSIISYFSDLNEIALKIESDSNYLLNIYSLSGRKVASYPIIGLLNYNLNISEFKPGIYIVNLYDNQRGSLCSKKILKK